MVKMLLIGVMLQVVVMMKMLLFVVVVRKQSVLGRISDWILSRNSDSRRIVALPLEAHGSGMFRSLGTDRGSGMFRAEEFWSDQVFQIAALPGRVQYDCSLYRQYTVLIIRI